MNEGNNREALIKRIDDILFDRGYKGRETPVSTDELVAIRTALTKKYVPMTEEELGDFWELDSSHKIVGALSNLQSEFIRRAGLEVQE